MEERKKELLKISKSSNTTLSFVIKKLFDNDLEGLDIKKMKDNDLYRCRVGKYGIIFKILTNTVKIMKIGNRGDIYKNL